MTTKAITVRIEDAVKEQAEAMLIDMGMNMTTYIVSSLKALVREKKIPFELVTTQYQLDQIILEKLTEAEREAANPNTKWLSHDEVFEKIETYQFREEMLDLREKLLSAEANRLSGGKTYTTSEVSEKLRELIDGSV